MRAHAVEQGEADEGDAMRSVACSAIGRFVLLPVIASGTCWAASRLATMTFVPNVECWSVACVYVGDDLAGQHGALGPRQMAKAPAPGTLRSASPTQPRASNYPI